MLGVVVIVVLLIAWAAVLAPSLLGRRAGDERDGFNETMGSLAATARSEAPASGRFVMVPKGPRVLASSRRELVVRRRRATFERLLVVAAATFLIALVPGLRAFFLAHFVSLVALAGYAIWLRNERAKEREARRMKRMIAREEERRRRIERQEQLLAQQEHIEAALASTAERVDEHGFGRAVGDGR